MSAGYFESDGNQIEDVYRMSLQARDTVQRSRKPVILKLNTYRFLEHRGPNDDNHLGYRMTPHELNDWKQRDPLLSFGNKVDVKTKIGIASKVESELDALWEQARDCPVAEFQSSDRCLPPRQVGFLK